MSVVTHGALNVVRLSQNKTLMTITEGRLGFYTRRGVSKCKYCEVPLKAGDRLYVADKTRYKAHMTVAHEACADRMNLI